MVVLVLSPEVNAGPTVPTGSAEALIKLESQREHGKMSTLALQLLTINSNDYLKEGIGEACMGHRRVTLKPMFISDVCILSPDVSLGITVPTGSRAKIEWKY